MTFRIKVETNEGPRYVRPNVAGPFLTGVPADAGTFPKDEAESLAAAFRSATLEPVVPPIRYRLYFTETYLIPGNGYRVTERGYLDRDEAGLTPDEDEAAELTLAEVAAYFDRASKAAPDGLIREVSVKAIGLPA